MATFNTYTSELVGCLATYQFIEEGLRFCLFRYHATVKFRLDGYAEYEVPFASIEDAALGRLLEWFKTYCHKPDLLQSLRSVKVTRDQLAHRGLALTLSEQVDETFLDSQIADLKAAKAIADACFKELLREMEAADAMVAKAYETLVAERVAVAGEIPVPFRDREPSGDA
ncbi:MAG: hypothetical protein HYZ18_09110 [Pseudogulbenkiania sp.]|nr:hypothetical protein [Pseudogulbenkiania sp.]